MTPLVQTAQYSTIAYQRYRLQNEWVQVVVYVLLAVAVLGSLSTAAFCIAKGGNVEWTWQFGIFIKIACKFDR